jgi:hypothetical protein
LWTATSYYIMCKEFSWIFRYNIPFIE